LGFSFRLHRISTWIIFIFFWTSKCLENLGRVWTSLEASFLIKVTKIIDYEGRQLLKFIAEEKYWLEFTFYPANLHERDSNRQLLWDLSAWNIKQVTQINNHLLMLNWMRDKTKQKTWQPPTYKLLITHKHFSEFHKTIMFLSWLTRKEGMTLVIGSTNHRALFMSIDQSEAWKFSSRSFLASSCVRSHLCAVTCQSAPSF